MKCDLEGKMVFKRSNLNVLGCHSKPSQQWWFKKYRFLLNLKHFEFRGHIHTFNGTKRSNYLHFSTLKLALLVGKRFLLHTRKKFYQCPGRTFTANFFVWNTLSEGPRAGTNFASNCFVFLSRGVGGISEYTQKSFCFEIPILEESYLARVWGGTSPFIACI